MGSYFSNGWNYVVVSKKISNYYAAGFDIDEFSISIDKDSAHMDLWLLSMFSTERMTFYSQGIIEWWKKIKTLLNHPPTREYLQVCVNGEKIAANVQNAKEQ